MGKLTIIKTAGGLGRRAPDEDNVSALVTTGVVATGYALNDIAIFFSVDDAIDLGIDAAFDAANDLHVFEDINEFFRMSPSGELHFLMADQITEDLTTLADKANEFAKKVLREGEGRIKQIAITRSPIAAYVPVLAGGLDDDVTSAIPKAQELYDEEEPLQRPAQFIIEGRSFNGTVGAADDLRANDAKNVSVVIAADPVVSASAAIHAGYAAAGTCLGVISSASVEENIGHVEKFNLLDAANQKWLEAGTSANVNISTFEASLDALADKGYIFARKYPTNSGVFFNDSPTNIVATSDFAFIESNRTIDKAGTNVFEAVLPKVNGTLLIDPVSGKLARETVAEIEDLASEGLDTMLTDGEISGFSVFVDPDQDVLQTSKLLIKIKIVVLGIAREITVEIGLALNL